MESDSDERAEALQYLQKVEEELDRRQRKLLAVRKEMLEIEAQIERVRRAGWGVITRGFQIGVSQNRVRGLRRSLESKKKILKEVEREVQMAQERKTAVLLELEET